MAQIHEPTAQEQTDFDREPLCVHTGYITSDLWATDARGDYMVTVWACMDCGAEVERQITR